MDRRVEITQSRPAVPDIPVLTLEKSTVARARSTKGKMVAHVRERPKVSSTSLAAIVHVLRSRLDLHLIPDKAIAALAPDRSRL